MKVDVNFVYEYILSCCLVSYMVYRWLVLRSNVMSRKSTTFLLTSMVICNLLCLKILHISFLIASTCLGDFMQVASPSSLYNPTLKSRWVSWDNGNSPTSSQVSALSKLPIVTSESDLFLRHGKLLL